MILKVVWGQQSSSAQCIATGDPYPNSLGQAAGPLPTRDHKPEHPCQDCSLRPDTVLTHAPHGWKQAKRRCLPRPALAAAICPGRHLLRGWGTRAPGPPQAGAAAEPALAGPVPVTPQSCTPPLLRACSLLPATQRGHHASPRIPNPALHRSGWCEQMKHETCWALSLVLSVAYLEPRVPQHLRQAIQNTSFL